MKERESVHAAAIRQSAKALVERAQERNNELGRLLEEIFVEQLYLKSKPEYSSFREYCHGELGFGERKAEFLRRIHRTFTKAGIPTEVLDEIGRTKARVIARVVNEGNKKEWIDKAKTLPFRALETEVRGALDNSKMGEEKAIGYVQVPFYTLEQRDFFLKALELAAKMTGTDSKTVNFEAMCLEFLGTYGEEGSHDQAAVSAREIPEAKILSKYGWRCANEDCRKRVSLSTHHMAFRSRRPDLIDDPNNKLPLCIFCHRKITDEKGELVEIDGKWAIRLRESGRSRRHRQEDRSTPSS